LSGPHSHAGQNTSVARLFMAPGGTLINPRRMSPRVTASRNSQIASRCQPHTSCRAGSTVGQAKRMKSVRLASQASLSLSLFSARSSPSKRADAGGVEAETLVFIGNRFLELAPAQLVEVARLARLLALHEHAEFLADQLQRAVGDGAVVAELARGIALGVEHRLLLHGALEIALQSLEHPSLGKHGFFGAGGLDFIDPCPDPII